MHIFQAISLSIFHALFLLFPFLFQQKKRKWWAQMDSNHRPHAYQACALTTWAMRPVWWRWGGSNSWPPACKAGALPAELHPHCLTSSFFNLPFSFRYPQNWTMSFSTFLLFPLIDLFRVQTNSFVFYSLERRWSSRTFRYGYLVTTSPQSSIPP